MFDNLKKKKMPPTPSKTNCQTNYFGSKVVPTEFNYNSEKKPVIQIQNGCFLKSWLINHPIHPCLISAYLQQASMYIPFYS